MQTSSLGVAQRETDYLRVSSDKLEHDPPIILLLFRCVTVAL
jgi:hypothetical protein